MEDNRFFEGLIQFDHSVYEMIATMTALETKGVAGMSTTFGDTVSSLFGRKNAMEGVKVQVMEDGSLQVSLHIAVYYGYRVPDIALRLQERVKSALVSMADATVNSVDIYVQDIIFESTIS
ncbi:MULTISPECIES: Asp23/Gls24 family envelope stress response protein [unclassified Veillonella]|uniref:Asp23/Gls24 family envelope stress response protein n=1 Tax=unclassified Veillonella TaxID=2630086 RepID=UPI000F8C752B|nr:MULTISPECIES: Asp23/Gls24 family envelope stress response protein [unclassified Veillonella]